jgi:hypothetical protein
LNYLSDEIVNKGTKAKVQRIYRSSVEKDPKRNYKQEQIDGCVNLEKRFCSMLVDVVNVVLDSCVLINISPAFYHDLVD